METYYTNPSLDWEELQSDLDSGTHRIFRTPIFGGWLVTTFNKYHNNPSITLYLMLYIFGMVIHNEN